MDNTELEKSLLSKIQTLTTELQNLATRVKTMEDAAAALTSPQLENRKLHFQEAGQWARHYSVVRMTVATFAITACATIIGLKWDQLAAEDYVWIAPYSLWLLASLVFYAFTFQTFDRLNSQLKYRAGLPAKIGNNKSDEKKISSMVFDAGSVIVSALSITFAVLACLCDSKAIDYKLRWLLVAVAAVWIIYAIIKDRSWKKA